jgi:hypothetical protein
MEPYRYIVSAGRERGGRGEVCVWEEEEGGGRLRARLHGVYITPYSLYMTFFSYKVRVFKIFIKHQCLSHMTGSSCLLKLFERSCITYMGILLVLSLIFSFYKNQQLADF